MAAVAIVLAIVILSPIAALFIFAASLFSALRHFNLHIQFRSALWISLLLAIADLLLTPLFRYLGLTGLAWDAAGVALLFALFYPLTRRYTSVSPVRALGVYARSLAFALLTSVACVIAVVLPLRLFVATPFELRGQSMEPTYHDRDIVVVDRTAYRRRDVQRGDVVVVITRYGYSVKRVVGLPGETVSFIRGGVGIADPVDGSVRPLPEPYLGAEQSTAAVSNGSVIVPPRAYFVLGDNRELSQDSREWGPVSRDQLVGVVSARLWPPSWLAS
jgi:signal peptidase I